MERKGIRERTFFFQESFGTQLLFPIPIQIWELVQNKAPAGPMLTDPGEAIEMKSNQPQPSLNRMSVLVSVLG
jgi:hypothetical protein